MQFKLINACVSGGCSTKLLICAKNKRWAQFLCSYFIWIFRLGSNELVALYFYLYVYLQKFAGIAFAFNQHNALLNGSNAVVYLFYFYVSSIIFQPHSILCFYILSIHIMCDLRRVERCHLENSLQMPKHFTSAEVRDFWENIFPLSRRFEATLYAL